MSGIDSNIDWTAPAMPGGDRMRPSLDKPARTPAAAEKRNVLDTLLGANKLSASDIGGEDPYNATGKHFRR